MTVKTREDYNKVLQGDIVPSSVGVRRYIPPKRARESEEGGSFVSKPGKAPPKQTKGGHVLIGKNHNEGPFYNPTTGIYSYTPYPTMGGGASKK